MINYNEVVMKRFLLLLVIALAAAPTQARAQNTATDGVVYATAQQFEHGLMIWRSDNSDIWVLDDSGTARYFSAVDYSPLPDNPIFGESPLRLRPLFGFGKVWGNYPDVRGSIGWPVQWEIGFSMPVQSINGYHYMTQLDNTVIEVRPDATWTRYPASSRARVWNLSASPNPVTPGGKYVVSWQAEGAEMVIIEVYDAVNNQQYGMFPDYPLVGSAEIPVPDFATSKLAIIVWAANKVYGTSAINYLTYNRLAHSSITLDVVTGAVG